MQNKKLSKASYDEKYYSEFCRRDEDFSRYGITNPYVLALDLLIPKKGELILDIGCGRGEIVRECIKKGASAVGIDHSREAVRIAKNSGLKLIAMASADYLPLRHEFFDKVCMMEVIEHLTDPQLNTCLKEAKRVLKRGGYIVITTPNAWNKVLYILAIICNKVGMKIKWMSREDPYHINVQNPLSLRRKLRGFGFRTAMFPGITLGSGALLRERLKYKLFFLFSHLHCKAYKV